jgi:hypothetical protein
VAFLGTGMAIGLAVVTYRATGSTAASAAAAITLAVLCYGVWFLYMVFQRARRGRP